VTRLASPRPLDRLDRPELEVFRSMLGPPKGDRFVAEGATPIARLLESPHEVENLVCTRAHWGRLAEKLDPERHARTRVFVAEHAQLRELVGFDFHRGCLASGPAPRVDQGVDPDLLDGLAARETSTILVTEGLADPANLGACIRNARAFGVDLVIADAAGASPWSRKAIRGSMGHAFTVPLVVCRNLCGAVARLADRLNCEILAATLDSGASLLPEVEFGPRSVLLVGNEGHGLTPELLAGATREVTIPIARGADSLNVAAATAVLLYGISNRRRHPTKRGHEGSESAGDPYS
jgi:tRNA G18 (ribose-2'-O)-methylase SpoU